MKFKKNILSISTSVAMLSMVGCGVTSQDAGQGSGAAVSGVAVDGYIAGGVVYVDTNENFEIDAWEPRAFTDARGYFTYAPAITNTEGEVIQEAIRYCDLPTSDASYQFCLKIPAAYDEVLVRVTKGYDLTTAEPFVGTMTMKMSANSDDLAQHNVVSPITGLLAKMTDEQKATFLTNENVPDLESVDFLDFSEGNPLKDDAAQRLRILSLALMVHNVSNIAGQQIATELHESVTANNASKASVGTMSNKQAASAPDLSLNSFTLTASDNVLKALLKFITSQTGTSTMSTLLENDSGGLASLVLADMKEGLEKRAPGNSPPQDPSLTSVADNVTNMRSVLVWTDEVTPTNVADLKQFVNGKLKVTEIVSTLINDKEDPAAVAKAIELSKDADFVTNLGDEKVDLNHLKKKFVDDPASVVAGDADYSTRQCFAEMLTTDNAAANGLTLTAGGGNANTEGLAFNTLNMSETNTDGTVKNGVVVDFSGDSTDATKGTMKITARFSEGDYAKKEKDAEGNLVLVGQEFSGTWNQLDPCTMLLTVDVAGVVESVIVKPTITKKDGNDVSAYNFDLGGEQRVWVPKTST